MESGPSFSSTSWIIPVPSINIYRSVTGNSRWLDSPRTSFTKPTAHFDGIALKFISRIEEYWFQGNDGWKNKTKWDGIRLRFDSNRIESIIDLFDVSASFLFSPHTSFDTFYHGQQRFLFLSISCLPWLLLVRIRTSSVTIFRCRCGCCRFLLCLCCWW